MAAGIVRLDSVIGGDAWVQAGEITGSVVDFSGYTLTLEWDGDPVPIVGGSVDAGNHAKINFTLSLNADETEAMKGKTYSGRLRLAYPNFTSKTIFRFTLAIDA